MKLWKPFTHSHFILIAILLMAAALRLFYFFFVFNPSSLPANDCLEYDLIARNILDGKGYMLYDQPTAFRAPLLSFLIAGTYWLFGKNYIFARLIVVGFSIALVLSIYVFGRQVVNHRIGLWSAFIAAVWIHFILYGSNLFTEIPYTFFAITSVIFVIHYLKNSKIIYFVLTAFSLALAILTRPVGLFLLFIIILYLFIHLKGRRNVVRTIVLGVLTVILISPWIYRNYLVFQRIIPVTTAGGTVLWISNNHYVAHHPVRWGFYVGYEQLPGAEKLISGNEVVRSGYAMQYTRDFVKNYPEDLPILMWNKVKRFWAPEIFTYSPRRWIIEFSYIVLLCLAIGGIGCAIGLKMSGQKWLWIILLANFVPALIYWSGPRIRLPAEPALLIFAAIFIDTLWKKRCRRRP